MNKVTFRMILATAKNIANENASDFAAVGYIARQFNISRDRATKIWFDYSSPRLKPCNFHREHSQHSINKENRTISVFGRFIPIFNY